MNHLLFVVAFCAFVQPTFAIVQESSSEIFCYTNNLYERNNARPKIKKKVKKEIAKPEPNEKQTSDQEASKPPSKPQEEQSQDKPN